MRMIADQGGNVILIENSKTYNGDALLNVYLRLKDEKHRKRIGKINTVTRCFHVELSEDMHMLKKANAYGFNHYLLLNASTFDSVVLHIGKCIYKIDRRHILNEGQFLINNQQGYEKEIYLTQEWIDHYEITVEAHKYNLLREKSEYML